MLPAADAIDYRAWMLKNGVIGIEQVIGDDGRGWLIVEHFDGRVVEVSTYQQGPAHSHAGWSPLDGALQIVGHKLFGLGG